MVKQLQVRPVRPVRTAAPVKTTAAVLIAGAAVTLAACSSGTSSSAKKAAAPHTTASPTKHSGSHKTGSHISSPGTHAASTGHAASPGTAASPARASKSECKHVASLRTSLQDLNHLTLNASSASKIRTDLTNIQTQLAALKGHGGSAMSSELTALSASVDKVRTAAHGLSTPPTAAQVKAITTALSQLKTQSKSALAAMNAACPK
jgi:hypothetical protein